ncbi:MAG TPA: hypothetical protein VGA37_01640 [Gemmatimonadales bacterium]
MTTPPQSVTPPTYVLPPDAVPNDEAEAVLGGAVIATADALVVDVTGSGAVDCMQGLLTNDLVQPGESAFVFGAVLTPKGMIVADMWAARDGGRVVLVVPAAGVDALMDLFQRSLPPRLARFAVRRDAAVLRLVGPRSEDVTRHAGIALPEEGRAGTAIAGEAVCDVAHPAHGAPFRVQFTVHRDDAASVRGQLRTAGALEGGAAALEIARMLSGWPRLGAEIGPKTLPQEVRFDEIDGVSYTKGCYTGQETVARVHFRGHANRHLVGLQWEGAEVDPSQPEVMQDDQERGRVTSMAWLAPMEQYIGLAVVRREVDGQRLVVAAGSNAGVVDLPFPLV